MDNVKCNDCKQVFQRDKKEKYKLVCLKCYIKVRRLEDDSHIWFRDDIENE